MTNKSEKYIIRASEVTDYEVCPEAWRLKHITKIEYRKRQTSKVSAGHKLRKEWVETQEHSSILKKYAKIAYLLLLSLVVVVFLNDLAAQLERDSRHRTAPPDRNKP